MKDKIISEKEYDRGDASFQEELAELREHIDEIDGEMFSLLESRMNIVKRVAEIKRIYGKPVEDVEREIHLLKSIKDRTQFHGYMESVYKEIIEQSKAYQKETVHSMANKEGVKGLRFIIINGPNLNLLGRREEEHYGKGSYDELVKLIRDDCKEHGDSVSIFQSNYEGDIITSIQNSGDKYDAIVINAGGYTHTSIAILDALKAVNLPAVEVHISCISNREVYRKKSYVSEYADKVIEGKGFYGYIEALEYLRDRLQKM